MKRGCIVLIGLAFSFFWLTNVGAEDVSLSPVVVTATRFSTSQTEVGRQVEVITKEEIQAMPAHSVNEVLEYLSSVDVRTRGISGMQTDFSIRGSNFEQVLILIDGMRINDPQTGHHLGDIPISLDEIKRIEVVPGGASALYGHGGFGGVINIITKKRKRPGVGAKFSHGQYDYNLESLEFSTPPFKDTQLHLDLKRQLSNGYRPDTDFDTKLGNFSLNGKTWQLFAGLQDKKFGANSFYSTAYPWQWEHTQTHLLSGQKEFRFDQLSFSPSFVYRRHNDHFVLDRSNPAFYQNHHRTHVYGFQLPLNWETGRFKMATGLEFGREDIKSSCLNNHSRWHEGIFWSINPRFRKLNTNLDLRLDHYSEDLGTEFSYNLSGACPLAEKLKVRASAGRSFRIPSYTELYYSSPANHGNPALNPEHAWNLEAGMDFLEPNWEVGFTLFRRWGRHVIDWNYKNGAYYAQNLNQVDTLGITLNSTFLWQRHVLKLDYTYLNQIYNCEGKAKYSGGYLRHKTDFILISHWPREINTTLSLSCQKRIKQSAYPLLDVKIEKLIKLSYGRCSLFLEGKNLLDANYEDITGVPMPGVWVWGGIEIRL